MPLDIWTHDSPALAGNPLGDPSRRRLHVVTTDGLTPEEPAPLVWYLAGYAGIGRGMLSDDPWQEGLEERLYRLHREGKIGPMRIALPDAFTKFGGCQYLSSSAVGDYETYLFEELRGLAEEKYAVSGHVIAGKSSGGFGAIVHAMKRPGAFDAVVCHSGDMGFFLSVFPDLRDLMNALVRHGGLEALVADFEKARSKRGGRWFMPVMVTALASVYSPNPNAPLGIELPFDVETGEVKMDVLERWSELDPVNIIDSAGAQESLKKMKLVFVDCGNQDEHGLQFGARTFCRKLREYGVKHEHEEFDGGHRGTSYRLDVSLAKISASLS